MVKEVHRQRVSKLVWSYALALERWALSTRGGKMFVEHVLQSIVAQGGSTCRRKGRIAKLAVTFAQPAAQNDDGVFA
jgi:hypothetical protein